MKTRPIKFRAWDKKYKDMKEVEDINFASNQCVLGIAYEQRTYYFPRDCILMQFTGLKDKSGVEIYEGDIELFPKGILSHSFTKGIIEWGVGKFLIRWTKTNWNDITKHLDLGKVIGNIYENPELLKK